MDKTIDFQSEKMFYEPNNFKDDKEMLDLIESCLKEQKKIGGQHFKNFKPEPKAKELVSKEALDQILESKEDISDIRTHKEISNCIVFHAQNLNGSLIDERVVELRRKADAIVIDRINKLFASRKNLNVEVSGHFWYPPGGFMSWHTNLRKPGWRMYVNYAEEEDKSFFRYRDPDTAEVVTSLDKKWNFRLFQITAQKPFWHCVYSDTNRFSLGYKIELKKGRLEQLLSSIFKGRAH